MSRTPKTRRPRLALVGPMLGVNPGWVVTQGEILADLFSDAGYDVRLTSHYPGRARRLADTLNSLFAWRNEVDVVIHMVFSGPAFGITDAASALGRVLGLPQIFTLRGGSLPQFTQEYPGWVRRVFGRAGAIVSPSRFLAHTYESDPLIGQKLRVIPNILFMDRYLYRHRYSLQPRLLWMRTFHDIYNPSLALDVLEGLGDTHPDAVLTMAGQDKGLLAPLQDEARERGLADRVRFAGFLELAGKQREFAEHDIYLNTNRVDNMPVSVLEAAAFGLPVVATKVGGIPYLLENEQTALLVGDGDAAAMTAAVRRLLDDPDLAGRLSANGRQLAESCAGPRVLAQWDTVIQELLAPPEVAHA